MLGMLSKNRSECVIAQIGNTYQGITTIGIDEDSSPEVTKFIINDSEITCLMISSDSLKNFCEIKKEDSAGLMSKLTNLIVIDATISDEDKALVEEQGFTIHFWHDVIEKGRQVAVDP